MKRGAASRVFFGVDKTNEDFGGLLLLSQVTLGKKSGMFDEHKGLCIVDNVLLGKGIARVISVIVSGTSPLSLPDAAADSLSYVKAFGGTEQRNLPNGYVELEYIEASDVSQYIPTNIIPDWTTEIDAKFRTGNDKTFTVLSRWTNSPTADTFGVVVSSISSNIVSYFGRYSEGLYQNDTSLRLNANQDVEYKLGQSSVQINTVTYSITRQNLGFKNVLPLWIFKGNFLGEANTVNPTGSRVYSIKIKTQGALVFNGVPAKNASGVVGLYDKVSGQFLTNQGTGKLIAGPAVTIPEEYTPIDYVHMLPNSYLLTDVIPVYNGHYEIDFQEPTTFTVTDGTILGGGTTVYGGLLFTPSGVVSGKFIVDAFGDTSESRYVSDIVAEPNIRYKFVYNNHVATLYRNDTPVFTQTLTGTMSNGAALCIKGRNDNRTVSSTNASLYMYSFRAWDSAGNLIADYIPCRQQTAIGLYDSVSGRFLTASAGIWNSGPVSTKLLPTPDTPMDIVSNNGVLKARHQSGLPLGYSALEYLQNSGTQYIDTSLIVNSNSYVKAEFTIKNNITAGGTIFGARPTGSIGGGAQLGHLTNGSIVVDWLSGTRYTAEERFEKDIPYIAEISNSVFTLKNANTGEIITTNTFRASTTSLTHALTIFGMNNGGTIVPAVDTIQLKSFTIENANDNKNMTLIPVKRLFDNVLGMYDTISGRFFTNDGTGDFVAGSTASDQVEVYADGTVETIEDTIGNTATAEMLLRVGGVVDEQEILGGNITRKVGWVVLDGTENWSAVTNGYSAPVLDASMFNHLVCTHFANGIPTTDLTCSKLAGSANLLIHYDAMTTVSAFKAFLASEYANGTPVIVLYCLENKKTESVAEQTLQVQAGDNTLEITQASLDKLLLEARYQKASLLENRE